VTEALTPEALAALRHDLRTPLNHIIGYTEMLLEDAPGETGLGETLRAAREALALINETDDVVKLHDALSGPRARIVAAISTLLQGAVEDGSYTADLRRILGAAERLVPSGTVTSRTIARGIPAPEPASGRSSESPGMRGARILVVDDGADNRDVLRRRLERSGHMVETAEHGRRALELLGTTPFDLVLLDVMMPELDGFAVLEAIKGNPALRDIPVIMISALDDMPGIVRCIEHGAEDFLSKPFDPVLLRARINASLEKKRFRDQEVEYLREVGRVIEAATAVEAGNYRPGGLAPVARRADELGRLARVFDSMVVQMKAREERLRNQVRDLRDDIEAARRTTKELPVAVDGGNLRTGERLGQRFEILAVLGRGGMGTVYLARDLDLDEEIAVKTLRPEFVRDATLLERFKDEIRLTRRLSDEHIVRTHDLGESGGVYFLTMEYVEGITLREVIDTRGRLGVSSTLAIAAQLAHSLAVAHEHGVIHRDIKPQNLLLDAAGVLKVMDFGVARLAERTTSVTEAGLAVGTPAYMPPEQLLGEAVDVRSDLYAAGVVLYECLTGHQPFEAPSVMVLVKKLLTEAARSPVELNAEVPPALAALVLRLLAKEPAERVQTARELELQLQSLD